MVRRAKTPRKLILLILLLGARGRGMTWRVNCVRNKDAYKQLARTSLKVSDVHVSVSNEVMYYR